MTEATSNKIKTSATIVAILLTIISLGRDCQQDHEITKLNYQQQSMAKQPEFVIREAKFRVPLRKDKKPVEEIQKSGPAILGMRFQYDTAKVMLLIENAGNAYGSYRGYCFADSMTDEPFLRKKLLSGFDGQVEPWAGPRQGIRKGVIDSLPLEIYLTRDGGQKGRYHILLLYTNQWDQLFDTYIWIDFTTTMPTTPWVRVRADTVSIAGSYPMINWTFYYPKFTEKDFGSVITAGRLDQDFGVYSSEERDYVKRSFASVFEKKFPSEEFK